MGKSFFSRRFVPDEGKNRNRKTLSLLLTLSFLFFVVVKFMPFKGMERLKKEMVAASGIMEKAMAALKGCRIEKEFPIDEEADPNRTGLIGLKLSPLTTSLGQLEAKRTTTNPNFAALLVFLLKKAGVKRGETIAVSASGSFPALIVAVLSASRAMELHPVLISSLGASQWGANHPCFHWLRMHECLMKAHVFEWQLSAASLGGDQDRGEGMETEIRSLIIQEIRESGIVFIEEPNLERNVRLRIAIYKKESGEDMIRAFVNIGGSWPIMGSDPEVLKLKPGLVKIGPIPPPEKRGLLHEMAFRRIPSIHLLYIRGLVRRYGLPWDPIPLPRPGEGKLYELARKDQPLFGALAAIYVFCFFFVLVLRKVIL